MAFSIDRYVVDDLIYESANSLVYRAHSPDRRVILKVLKQDHPSADELIRYKQEFELSREIGGENVAHATEMLKHQQAPVIVVEDFGGSSLQLLLAGRPMALNEFFDVAIGIVQALRQVHDANVIHKDVNPSNVVLNRDTGTVKLIDFGISTKLSEERPDMRPVQRLEGTLAYLSPEQTGRMNRVLDYRTDFYSLGATLFELLTGRVPFEGHDALEIVHQQLAKQPQFRPDDDVPVQVQNIVLKLLEKNAEDRYQNAASLAVDLQRCRDEYTRSGDIETFPLGREGATPVFHVSQKLYGRDGEIRKLLQTYEHVAQGNKQLMLIAGYSGIGKTSLVHEVHRRVSETRGYYLAGKFDQFQRNVPYKAIAGAIEDLVRQILAESDAQLAAWHATIQEALDANGQLILDLVPQLEAVVGPQPPLPNLDPIEAQNNFKLVIQRFISAICAEDHPLVIFLDDLQWADLATLQLMQTIMMDDTITNLLLIGAYRDNEVDADHPLAVMLRELEQSNPYEQLVLAPLDDRQLDQLIADTLGSDVASVRPLGELVMAKTRGNPFFVNQFLRTLHQESLIEFDLTGRQWRWHLRDIEKLGITENVADLMSRNLERLPEDTRAALRSSACIGNRFNLATLAIVEEVSVVDVFRHLEPALYAGLIQPLSSFEFAEQGQLESPLIYVEFKFLHDRVQQAAYAEIDEDARKELHLRIARLLLASLSNEDLEDRVFEVTDHINQALALTTADETARVLELNLCRPQGKRCDGVFSCTAIPCHRTRPLHR